MALVVKNLPANKRYERLELDPGLGILLEEEMATHSSILAWRIPMDRGAWQVIVRGVTKSQT